MTVLRNLLVLSAMSVALLAPVRAESAAETLALTKRVADWQLAHLDVTHSSQGANDQNSQTGWVYGTFFVGLTALADRDPHYTKPILDHGARQQWGLEARPFHADDYIIGATWVWAYEATQNAKTIALLRHRLDMIAQAAPTVSLEYGSNPPPHMESACQLRWCWADALFMGPQVWAAMSRATKDPKYLAYADKEYWATVAYLFDEKEDLMARDSRFFTRRGPQGEKIFWSRGNGWVYAGLARMLTLMPKDYPSRPRYEALFGKMSARLIALQKPDGYWPVSLLGPRDGTPPETSGTAFYTYGLAYGVRSGLLTDPVYRDAAFKGWSALKAAVQSDGKLGWVQHIGVGPDAVKADDTELFGIGGFLLAGTEIAALEQ